MTLLRALSNTVGGLGSMTLLFDSARENQNEWAALFAIILGLVLLLFGGIEGARIITERTTEND